MSFLADTISLAMVDALEGPPPTGGRENSVYSAASFLRSSYRALSASVVGAVMSGIFCMRDSTACRLHQSPVLPAVVAQYQLRMLLLAWLALTRIHVGFSPFSGTLQKSVYSACVVA